MPRHRESNIELLLKASWRFTTAEHLLDATLHQILEKDELAKNTSA